MIETDLLQFCIGTDYLPVTFYQRVSSSGFMLLYWQINGRIVVFTEEFTSGLGEYPFRFLLKNIMIDDAHNTHYNKIK